MNESHIDRAHNDAVVVAVELGPGLLKQTDPENSLVGASLIS